MTNIEQLREMIERVRSEAAAEDDERAHRCEFEAREFALRCIAAGSPDAAELARLALSTDAIEFYRHFA